MDKGELVEAPKTTLESLKSGSILEVMPKERKEALKKAIGPRYKNITDAELELFAMIAVRYNLDPFIKEIFFTKQKGSVVPITGRDGFLKIAKMDPGYDGLESYSICANDEFRFDAGTGEINHIIAFGDRGEVKGAWARAYHKERKPAVAYVNFNEYDKGKSSDAWNTYPSAMIQKVAESFVLRRQFNINGIVGAEEIGADTNSKVAGIQVPNFSDPIYTAKEEEVVEGEFTVKNESEVEDKPRPMGEIEAKIQADKISKQLKEEEDEQDKILDKVLKDSKEIQDELVKEGHIPKPRVEKPKPTKKMKIASKKAEEIKEAEKIFPSAPAKEEEEMPSLDDVDDSEVLKVAEVKSPVLIKVKEKFERKNGREPTLDELKEEFERFREAGGVSVKEYMEGVKVLNK